MNLTPDFVYQKAKIIIEQEDQEHGVLALIKTQENKLVIVSLAELSETIKDNFQEFFQDFLRKHRAFKYFLVTEAWMTTSPRGLHQAVYKLPRDDRDEVLLVLECENHKKMSGHYALIRRTREGRKLGPLIKGGLGQDLTGRMMVSDW